MHTETTIGWCEDVWKTGLEEKRMVKTDTSAVKKASRLNTPIWQMRTLKDSYSEQCVMMDNLYVVWSRFGADVRWCLRLTHDHCHCNIRIFFGEEGGIWQVLTCQEQLRHHHEITSGRLTTNNNINCIQHKTFNVRFMIVLQSLLKHCSSRLDYKGIRSQSLLQRHNG